MMTFRNADVAYDEEVVIETTPAVDEAAKKRLLHAVNAEGQVIVHCKLAALGVETYARIWDSTFLIDRHSNHKSKLLFLDGITRFPVWTEIPAGVTLYFTLIFSALPKSCIMFDFLEQIPEDGGFHISDIQRNTTDVYKIDLTTPDLW